MADKKISQLTAASQVNSDAVFPLSQIVSGSDATVKATVGQVGDYIADEQNFAGLHTTAKDLIGAINEIAAGGGGGGGVTPTFSETVLVDNSSLASSFTFSDDYHNYDFLRFKLNNYVNQTYTIILTTPEAIDAIFSITSVVNFNEFGNNQYCTYSESGLTWSRDNNRNLNIYEVVGLKCNNATVTKTEIYKASSISGNNVPISTQLNLLQFDWILFCSNDSSWDEIQPCVFVFVPSEGLYNGIDIPLTYYFNPYAATAFVSIDDHSISSQTYAYIVGINFT